MKQNTEHTVHITEIIPAPIEQIWKIICNFNGLPSYHPVIKASQIERGDAESVGSIRYLTLESGYVREKLLMLDDSAYAFDYSIIEGTLPVKNYKASVRLTFDEGKKLTICEWWADFEVINAADRDALIDLVGQNFFKVGLLSVAKLLMNSSKVTGINHYELS